MLTKRPKNRPRKNQKKRQQITLYEDGNEKLILISLYCLVDKIEMVIMIYE
jgi:hypothetical protein